MCFHCWIHCSVSVAPIWDRNPLCPPKYCLVAIETSFIGIHRHACFFLNKKRVKLSLDNPYFRAVMLFPGKYRHHKLTMEPLDSSLLVQIILYKWKKYLLYKTVSLSSTNPAELLQNVSLFRKVMEWTKYYKHILL